MSQSFPVIGIIGKQDDPGINTTVRALVDQLTEHGREVVLDVATAQTMTAWPGARLARRELGQECALVIVVGGDGTLLDAGRAVAEYETPLLGINLGRLGFMVDVLPANMAATLEQVLAGDFLRDRRLLLRASVDYADGRRSESFYALNETVVRNAEFARVLDFNTFMDGRFISRHRADGYIVATPTGSTAYALSGGGPVLHPAIDALALVPICPHTLSDRPLVIDGRSQVTVTIGGGADSRALFTVDGQHSHILGRGDTVTAAKAREQLNLIHPPDYDYFKILRNKLHWGRGQSEVDDP